MDDTTGTALHDATFRLSCPDDRHADRVRTALESEVGAIDDDRSQATLADGDEPGTVEVTVQARDVPALRAATGTWLGLLEAADATVTVADETPAGTDRDGRVDDETGRDRAGEPE